MNRFVSLHHPPKHLGRAAAIPGDVTTKPASDDMGSKPQSASVGFLIAGIRDMHGEADTLAPDGSPSDLLIRNRKLCEGGGREDPSSKFPKRSKHQAPSRRRGTRTRTSTMTGRAKIPDQAPLTCGVSGAPSLGLRVQMIQMSKSTRAVHRRGA